MKLVFLATLVILVVASESREIPQSRSSIGKPLTQTSTCLNTRTGKYYLADNEGRICERKDFDSTSGCCLTGNQYSCETCEADSCCNRFENCVSCCLKPDNKASEKYRISYRVRGWKESGKWSSEFEYCQGICRTWTYSTVHENAFLNSRRFCFSDFGRPLIPEVDVPTIPSEIQATKGGDGEDCTSVCKQESKTCAPHGFASLNSCNVLRKYFICEAGCGEIEDSHGSEPYYITESAEKKDFPAYCVRHQPASEVSYDCEWKAPDIQRLCPCTKA